MIDELWIDIVDKMIKEKDKLYKISTQELIELTDKYTQLLEDMQK